MAVGLAKSPTYLISNNFCCYDTDNEMMPIALQLKVVYQYFHHYLDIPDSIRSNSRKKIITSGLNRIIGRGGLLASWVVLGETLYLP